jgi:acyl-CoA synthetase (AMP-forming)/AMP-acid ligase II
MLYERWRQTVKENRNELALQDDTTGRRWTFVELTAAVENAPPTPGPIAFPQGISADFVIAVLRAWSDGKQVCPLETGQEPPVLAESPPGGVHLKTTSATSGVPKFIVFTAEQLIADADNIVATMGLCRDWPNLGVISLAHSYGFSNLVLPLLLHGIPLILLNSPLPESVRRAVLTCEGVTLAAVPALWRAWSDARAITAHIRLAISAGAPLPLVLEQAVFETAGIKIHNFYGASECGGIAYDATAAPRADGACVGAPLKNVDLFVNDDGCLEVGSGAVGWTYWPESSESLTNGCYRTSDLAEFKGGLVYLHGRTSDLINVAGRKVTPETVEQALRKHPRVRDCLVFGVTGGEAERLEIIVACVALRSRTGAEELRQFLLQQLPSWQVPREWMFVESLEVNQRGKLSRSEWRRKFLESRP